MKIYEEPTIDIVSLENTDVLSTSKDPWNPDIETPPIWET